MSDSNNLLPALSHFSTNISRGRWPTFPLNINNFNNNYYNSPVDRYSENTENLLGQQCTKKTQTNVRKYIEFGGF